MFHRHLSYAGHVNDNLNTLLNNSVIKTTQTYTNLSTPISLITIPHNHSSWADSLTAYVSSGNLHLIRPSYSTNLTITPATNIIELPHNLTPETISWAHSHNIHTISDLYYTSSSSSTWHDLTKTPLHPLSQTLPTSPPSTPPLLQPQQLWIPSSDSTLPEKTILEIVGFADSSTKINYRTWFTSLPRALLTTTTHASRSHSRNQRGAATTTSATPLQVLGISPRRAFLGPPTDIDKPRSKKIKPKKSSIRYFKLITPPSQ